MGYETIEYDGIRYAEIIRAGTVVKETTFYSPPDSSFQFGLLTHKAGFVEEAHYHFPTARRITDSQQMLVVQHGSISVLLYSDDGRFLKEVFLRAGDAILIIQGVHAIKALEDMQCISVKQGPFLGVERDKTAVEVKE